MLTAEQLIQWRAIIVYLSRQNKRIKQRRHARDFHLSYGLALAEHSTSTSTNH